MSSNNENQNLFTILLDSVLTKVSRVYKIKLDELKSSIGTITFTDNLSDSINSFCSILNPVEVPAPKRVLKKIIKPNKETEVSIETPTEPEVSAETIKDAPKPKKVLKKAVPVVEEPKEPETVIQAPTEPETIKDVPKPKKVLKKAVPVVEAPKELETVIQAPTEPQIVTETPKPKKVLKKAVPAVEAPKDPETIVEAPKPKKVLKKNIPVVETPKEPEVVTEVVTEVVAEESEVKIKPKKIIVKRPATETVIMPEPEKKKSIKEVDVVEYGLDEQHDENAAVYDSIKMYEDDLLMPHEINGVKYLIDSSEYIYDMESHDLLGKLSEKDKTTILFLKNFTQ
jgi:hypothetical protein